MSVIEEEYRGFRIILLRSLILFYRLEDIYLNEVRIRILYGKKSVLVNVLVSLIIIFYGENDIF